jgi:hypothetical protein
MIEGEDHYYDAPDGKRYKVGDIIPVLRLPGLVTFNEKVIFGCCDMCDWAILGPASMVHAASQSHMTTHVLEELEDGFGDDFRHPDFTE